MPCIDPSGAVGLYDLVNGLFYGNARAGVEDFVAGVEYDSLPIGYKSAAYIESTTAHQYIDTGYIHGTNDLVVMEYYAPKTWQDKGYCYIFGSRGAGSGHTNRENWFFYIGGHNQDIVAYNHQNFDDAISPATYDYESPRIHLECQASTARWACGALNGSFTTATTFANWSAGQWPLFIFGSNFGGSFNADNAVVLRLYSFKIYRDVNGAMVLQRDMVPCVSHTGAAGLYDKVGRRFYGNAREGVEDFTVCLDDKSLPEGYTAAKYIQSTSAHQYVDTGYTHGTNDLVVMDYYAPRSWQDKSYCYLFGSKASNPSSAENWYFYIAGVNWEYFAYCHNAPKYVKDANLPNYDYASDHIHLECQARSATWRCGDKTDTITTDSTFANWRAGNWPLYIFTGDQGGDVGNDFCTVMRLYSFKIYRDIGGEMALVRDVVPVFNPSGAAGLFDFVGRRFYGNARAGVEDFKARLLVAPTILQVH